MENAKLCQACGTELNETEVFCHNCGAKYEAPVVEEEAPEAVAPKKTFCTNCGAELAEGTVFCSNCGTKNEAPAAETAPVAEAAPAAETAPAKPGVKILGAPIMTFVKKSALLLMALLVFISSFLPVFTMTFEYDEDEEFSVNVNAYQVVGFAFDAMMSQDIDEIEDSALYEKAEEYAEDHFEDWMEGDDLESMGKYYLMMYRLELRSEYSELTFAQFLASMFALTYVILVIAAFIFAIFNFLSLIVSAFGDFDGGVTSMLCAIAPVAVLVYAATLIGFGYMAFNESGVNAIGGGAVMAIICAVLGAAYVAVDRFFLAEKKAEIKSGAIVKRTLALIGCLTLLFMTFAPIFTTSVYDIEFEGREDETDASVGIGAEFFGGLILTPDEEEEYEEYGDMPYEFREMFIGQMISELSKDTKKDFEAGKSTRNIDLVKFLVLHDTPGVATLYRIVAGLFVLVAACAAAITWQNFRAIALGVNPRRGIVLSSKIISIVLSVFAVIFTAMFVAEAGGTIPYDLEDYYKVIIGIGPILSVVFAIFTTAVPTDNIKEQVAPQVIYVVQQPQQPQQ